MIISPILDPEILKFRKEYQEYVKKGGEPKSTSMILNDEKKKNYIHKNMFMAVYDKVCD